MGPGPGNSGFGAASPAVMPIKEAGSAGNSPPPRQLTGLEARTQGTAAIRLLPPPSACGTFSAIATTGDAGWVGVL